MATIELALNGDIQTMPEKEASVPTLPVPTPSNPIPFVPNSNVTQKTVKKESKSSERQALDDALENIQAEHDAINEIEEEQHIQEQSIGTASRNLIDAVKKIGKGTSITLEKLPTPGSIVLPLILLLVFFMILIPINGKSRIAWLWLVVTGNAQIQLGSDTGASASVGGSASGNFGGGGPSLSTGADITTTFTGGFIGMMTGAEDV